MMARFAAVLVALVSLGAGGCGGAREVGWRSARLAPGARARLQFEPTAEGRTLVTIEAVGLPPPERLGPGLDRYVVWVLVEPPGSLHHEGAGARDDDEAVPAEPLRFDPRTGRGSASITGASSGFTVQLTAEGPVGDGHPGPTVVFSHSER